MNNGRKLTEEKRAFMNDAEGRCQLCGRKRELELHHIIPLAYDGPDIKENWIMICRACHALLTPHRALTMAGIRRAKRVYTAGLIKKTIQSLDSAFPNDEWLAEIKDFVIEDCNHIINELNDVKED